MPELELKPLPMAEAQEFWRDKVLLSPAQFSRFSAEAKLKAFAVSGIAKGDELATVYNAIGKAIDQGITFEQFKAECGDDIFTRRGWTGKRAWRVDNIFRTNIQSAYNVGRYTRLKEMTDAFPFWKYSAVNDSLTRPTHLAMNGKVFPAEHPFWDQWYPPNGYRCRCSVIPLTASQVKKRGLQVETEIPQLIEPIDPVTGNRMPARQLIPDPGFAHHPGKAYWEPILSVMEEKAATWPKKIAAPMLADMVKGPVFAKWYEAPKGMFPVGVMKAEDAARIKAGNGTAMLSEQTAIKQHDRHPELSPAEYAYVQQAFDSGWPVQDGERSLIYLLEQEGYVTVVKSTVSGKRVFLTSFRRLSSDAARKSREIARLMEKGGGKE